MLRRLVEIKAALFFVARTLWYPHAASGEFVETIAVAKVFSLVSHS
jgi:hypothetical protein